MTKYVIIGNSAAGVSAVEAIRDWDKECKITLISDENTLCYSRCLLPNYLAGEMSRNDIIIRDTEWYKLNKVKLLLGKKVLKVDEKEKEIHFCRGSPLHYDSLLIATGSSPIFPIIDGIDKDRQTRMSILPMVIGFRTIFDVDKLLKVLPEVRRAVVLGAGFIGLKAAYGLWKRGIQVTIIEKLPHLLPRMLDIQGAEVIANCLQEKGIELRTNSTVTQIIENKGVKLDTGELIKCELVIVAVGVKPNIGLVEGSGININQGILVDEYMRTNIPDVYAAGDVAEGIDFLSGKRTINAIWPSATKGGRVAGYNMIGEMGPQIKKRYDADLPMNAVEFFSIFVVSMGIIEISNIKYQISKCKEKYETVSYSDTTKKVYKKIVLENGRIVGMTFVGDIRKAGIILSLIKRREDISLIKSKLLDTEVLAYSPITTKLRNLLHYPMGKVR